MGKTLANCSEFAKFAKVSSPATVLHYTVLHDMLALDHYLVVLCYDQPPAFFTIIKNFPTKFMKFSLMLTFTFCYLYFIILAII